MKKIWEVSELAFAHLINDIYAPVLMAIQPVLIASLGYNYFEAALLPAAHCIISSVLQPLFGYLADRRGLQIGISISILLSGCGIAAIGVLSNHFLIMFICVAVSAAGHASFHPGALCKVSAISSSGDRGRLTSLFVVGGNMGFALGPIIAGVALASGGIPALIWFIIPAVIGALIMHTRREQESCTHERKIMKPAGGGELEAGYVSVCRINTAILGHFWIHGFSPDISGFRRIFTSDRNNYGYNYAPCRGSRADIRRNYVGQDWKKNRSCNHHSCSSSCIWSNIIHNRAFIDAFNDYIRVLPLVIICSHYRNVS